MPLEPDLREHLVRREEHAGRGRARVEHADTIEQHGHGGDELGVPAHVLDEIERADRVQIAQRRPRVLEVEPHREWQRFVAERRERSAHFLDLHEDVARVQARAILNGVVQNADAAPSSKSLEPAGVSHRVGRNQRTATCGISTCGRRVPADFEYAADQLGDSSCSSACRGSAGPNDPDADPQADSPR